MRIIRRRRPAGRMSADRITQFRLHHMLFRREDRHTSGTPSELNNMACPVCPTVASDTEWEQGVPTQKNRDGPDVVCCCSSSMIGVDTLTTRVPKADQKRYR